jgi:hypothetical protein
VTFGAQFRGCKNALPWNLDIGRNTAFELNHP